VKKNQKFLIAGVVIVLAISYLVYVGVKESGVYFLTVTELKSDSRPDNGRGVRVSGVVIDGSIEEETMNLILRFKVMDEEGGTEDNYLNVYYKGVKPDSFKADVQVILEGKYSREENLLKATTLLVKCPSRYEGEEVPEEHDYSSAKKGIEDKPGAD
jgi:cytochrome c-type biogenesis protein CcmE